MKLPLILLISIFVLVQKTVNGKVLDVECEETKKDTKSTTCTLSKIQSDDETQFTFRSSQVTWWWFIKEDVNLAYYTTVHVINSRTRSIPRSLFKEFPNLETLQMKATGIEEWHPLTFMHGGRLKDIVLSDNEIKQLPQIAFYNANVLEVIDMENNQIQQIDRHAFINLQTLRKLFLKGNLLKQLTLEFITNDKLNLIDVSENHLSKLHLQSDVAFQTHSKKELKINAGLNEISDFSIQDSFPVTSLFLPRNNLTGMSTVINLKTLKHLNLESNPLGILPLTTFFTLTQLEYLNVNDALMTNLNAALFARLTKLKHLDISNNNFTRIDWNTLAALSQLEELSIFEYRMALSDAQHLATIFPHLKRVWISGSAWDCEDYEKISGELQSKGIKVNDDMGVYAGVSPPRGVFCVPTVFL